VRVPRRNRLPRSYAFPALERGCCSRADLALRVADAPACVEETLVTRDGAPVLALVVRRDAWAPHAHRAARAQTPPHDDRLRLCCDHLREGAEELNEHNNDGQGSAAGRQRTRIIIRPLKPGHADEVKEAEGGDCAAATDPGQA